MNYRCKSRKKKFNGQINSQKNSIMLVFFAFFRLLTCYVTKKSIFCGLFVFFLLILRLSNM